MEEATALAEQWAADWNARAVERVLELYSEDVVFSSPVALTVTGNAIANGKHSLRAYWMRALDAHHSLRFSIDRTLWDPLTFELAIVYEREINARAERGLELMTFGADGLVFRGEAFYGAKA